MANESSKRHSAHVGIDSLSVAGNVGGGFAAVIGSMKAGQVSSGTTAHAHEETDDEIESANLCEAMTTFGSTRPRRCRRPVEDGSGVCELHQPKKPEPRPPAPPDENELRFAELEARIAALEAMLAAPAAARGRAR